METYETAKRLYQAVMKTYQIEDAFERWEIYRRQTTEFILEQTKDCYGGSLAILGAGNCNDVDLVRMSKYFSSITLLDMNQDAMNQAISRYHAMSDCDTNDSNQGIRASITAQSVDFLGISESAYLDFCKAEVESGMLGFSCEADLVEFMDTYYEMVSHYCWKTTAFDVVVSLGVHSQLNALFPRLWFEWSQLMRLPNRHLVEQRAMRENMAIIQRFDNQLISMATKHLIVGCEKQRLGISGGIAGASEALVDFESRVNSGQLRQMATRNLNWNLTETKIYDMRLLSLVLSDMP